MIVLNVSCNYYDWFILERDKRTERNYWRMEMFFIGNDKIISYLVAINALFSLVSLFFIYHPFLNVDQTLFSYHNQHSLSRSVPYPGLKRLEQLGTFTLFLICKSFVPCPGTKPTPTRETDLFTCQHSGVWLLGILFLIQLLSLSRTVFIQHVSPLV